MNIGFVVVGGGGGGGGSGVYAWVCVCVCGVYIFLVLGNQTQDIKHARQVLYHRTQSPALNYLRTNCHS
jgi:hypothetical protein